MAASLCLLGPFVARSHQDQAVRLTSRKAQALLAYLATQTAGALYREALSGLLWPDRPDRTARSSLRQAVHDLRHALGDDVAPTPLLLVSRETIQINPDAHDWLDVAAFERATAAISWQPHAIASSTDCETLRGAVALYRGPFLEGLTLADSPAFEEWLLLKREQLNRQMLLALHALATFYEGRSAYDEALVYSQRAIELEPWQEEAHQQSMRILALAGRRSEALVQYRRCWDLMVHDIGVEPGPETTALYESIRDGAIIGQPSSPPGPVRLGDAPSPRSGSAEVVAPSLLVAREQEMAKLRGALSHAMAGEGRVILVTGEAGTGKTTLVEEFGREAIATWGDLLVTIGRCSSQLGAGDAYQPFRETLRMLAGDSEGALNPRHARSLRTALPLALEALVEEGPELARLLARDSAALMSRARACAPRDAAWMVRLERLVAHADDLWAMRLQGAALCEQATRVLRAIASHLPLLVILDDLQWADARSLDMLFHLGRHLQGSRILIVGALRLNEDDVLSAGAPHPLTGIVDEFQRQWGDIRVDLAQAKGRAFVEAYLDSQPNRLGAHFRETLAHHTDGNALFTVELVRAMQERGDLLRDRQGLWIEGPNLDWRQLPSRVEAVVSQRMRQLTAAQLALLQAASVEGDEFHAEVLAHVQGVPTATTVASLSGSLSRQAHLVTPGNLVTVGERRLARYRFRHGLFRNYLYGQLDAATQAHLHGAVGAALEALYGEQESLIAGQLAKHFEAAGQAGKAAHYLLEAGRQAAQVGAHHEAIACYERAIALLADLPTAERTEPEFALQMALDRSLLFTLGWGAPERMRTAGRAYELGRQMGRSTPTMFGGLRGFADLLAVRGEYERAVRLAHELLAVAERVEAPVYIASAHTILAICSLMQGDVRRAGEHATQALALCLNPAHALTSEEMRTLRPHADLVVAAVLMVEGYLDQARQQLERVTYDEEWPNVEVTGYTRSAAALFYATAHQDREARQQATEALRAIEGRDLPEVRALSETVLGWAEARAGQFERGTGRLAAAVAVQREHSTLTFRFLQSVLLVEGYMAGGQLRAAWRAIQEALSQAERTGTHSCDAQLWRLRGEVLLQDERAADGHPTLRPEDCFQRALEIARQQGARLYELCATMSVARLWAQEGRAGEARDALAAIYGAFSEGLNTPDLVEAKELLDDLSRQNDRPA